MNQLSERTTLFALEECPQRVCIVAVDVYLSKHVVRRAVRLRKFQDFLVRARLLQKYINM